MGSRWDRYWFGEASLMRLAVFRIFVMAAAFYAVWHFRISVFQHAQGIDVSYLGRSWRPIFALEALGIGPPGPRAASVLWAAMLASLALGLVGLATRAACAVAAVLVAYWIAVHYSFGQPHHDCVALFFALAALPFAPVGRRFSLDALLGRVRRAGRGGDPRDVAERAPWAALPWRLTQLTIALGYFFAGATKLVLAGPLWADGYTLQGIMIEYRSPWSEALASRVEVCALMSAGLLLVQTSFPLIFLARALRWVYVPLAVAFHLMAMQTMATGTFLSLWLLLVSFVPTERAPGWLRAALLEGPPVRRAAAWAGCSLAAGTTLALFFRTLPGAMWLALVPIALAGVLACLPRLRATLTYDAAHASARRFTALLLSLDWARRLEATPGPVGATEQGRRPGGRDLLRAAVRTPLGLLAAPLAAPFFGRLRVPVELAPR